MKEYDPVASMKKMTDPQIMRKNLIMAALFIATHEVLKMIIVENPKSFFGDYAEVKGEWKAVKNQSYEENVLKGQKDEYKASAKWFRDENVITEDEYQMLLKIREHRNAATHELPRLLIDADFEIDTVLLIEAKRLIHKIDEWWIREIEMTINPPDHIEDIENAEVQSGRMIMIDQIFTSTFADLLEEKESGVELGH